PCIYLVDSGGAFLPKQDEVFRGVPIRDVAAPSGQLDVHPSRPIMAAATAYRWFCRLRLDGKGLSIALSSSSSDRGEIPSRPNPGRPSEAVVSICISST